jgi:hypothetical protein
VRVLLGARLLRLRRLRLRLLLLLLLLLRLLRLLLLSRLLLVGGRCPAAGAAEVWRWASKHVEVRRPEG